MRNFSKLLKFKVFYLFLFVFYVYTIVFCALLRWRLPTIMHIAKTILTKIQERHNVSPKEIDECLMNRDGGYLVDTREEHQTNPQTLWFIAETNKGRLLKICFIPKGDGNENGPTLKSAFEPNEIEKNIYQRKAYK